ncbi:MAG TPA: hypothetical protein G4N92_01965 [Anaerolineae bacterium]|nr:hypothetical protein [Anaerolineae bacterium]
MSILNKLASMQNRRDGVPNQELAKELVEHNNLDGIREIAGNLWNKDKNIQSDCIKVFEEIGYLKPELIGDYVHDFLKLLKSKNNRLVWGAMIALSTIAVFKAKEIAQNSSEIIRAIEKGSVITVDGGIKALSLAASVKEDFKQQIFPFLIDHLKRCRPKEAPMHAEFIMCAVDSDNKEAFRKVLKGRSDILKPSQLKRIKKINQQLENI